MLAEKKTSNKTTNSFIEWLTQLKNYQLNCDTKYVTKKYPEILTPTNYISLYISKMFLDLKMNMLDMYKLTDMTRVPSKHRGLTHNFKYYLLSYLFVLHYTLIRLIAHTTFFRNQPWKNTRADWLKIVFV